MSVYLITFSLLTRAISELYSVNINVRKNVFLNVKSVRKRYRLTVQAEELLLDIWLSASSPGDDGSAREFTFIFC